MAEAIRVVEDLQAQPSCKHVAIVGVSYCGSTLLARILGSLEGVANIGESHWLTQRKDKGASTSVALERAAWADLVHCHHCGPGCPILCRDFRVALQADPVDWYQKIANRLGTKTLVSSDKNHDKLRRRDPLLRLDAVVLFKSPRQAWLSNLSKQRLRSATMSPETDLGRYLDKWAAAYETLLDGFDNQGVKVCVSWENFCVRPYPELERLCRAVGLPFDSAVLQRVRREQHCLGGNARVNRTLDTSDELTIAPVCDPVPLRDRDTRRIAAHAHSRVIYERLRRLADEDPWVTRARSFVASVLGNLATTQQVLPAKRAMFEGAARDARDVIRERLSETWSETGERAVAERRLREWVLEHVDLERHARVQERTLDPERFTPRAGKPRDVLKYLNLDYWLGAKLRVAMALALHESAPLDILDIGAGPGHFGLVCRQLGHRVFALDAPLESPPGDRHPYDELIDLFGIERRTYRVMRREHLPDLGRRFDLVTAQGVTFDTPRNLPAWSLEDWRFFLRDVARDVATDTGRLHLVLNRTRRDTSVSKVSESLLGFFSSLGATVDEQRTAVWFADLSRLR